ncbi:MAG TPA: tRNA (N6-isopentenyl adenosine(37)-C2)-methylthiotransferase MiaB [Thermoanaerobaculia bacterium]|nr:tRNA (N6-isopentenyl adenosine(37)-C2)-methylthiotransferase MiaB [Thermoanaerobaculia bacterium]
MTASTSEKAFFIETWGCQMNDLDSQRLAGQLRLRGWRRVEDASRASLILLNTCSIRDKSENKVFSRLGELRGVGRSGVRVGVAGCVAQQEGEAILARAPWVDFVMGPGNVGALDQLLDGTRKVAVDFPADRRYDYLSIDRPSRVRAQVTIIEGCNKNCTFCIVPTTRGREVSRPMREIVGEIRWELRQGRAEVELLGQTVNAYRCPESGTDFAGLLETIARLPGLLRLRFVTSHPAEVTDRLIEVMRDYPVICRYLHLPVQSGSSRVLRRMKRLYTREQYLDVIERIRTAIPGMNFSTDIIVGFPGETEEDFEQTLSLVEKVGYGSLFGFLYSPRPGTPAPRLGPPVEHGVAAARLGRLFALQERFERRTLRSWVGRIVPVLYEGSSAKSPEVLAGKTEHNWTVNFTSARPASIGELVPVRIDHALHHSLRGEAVA